FTQAATSNGRMALSVSPRFSHQAKNLPQARIGPPDVVVVDVGGEEFDVAPAGLVAAGVGDQRGHYIGAPGRGCDRRRSRRVDDGGELVVRGSMALPYPDLANDKDVIIGKIAGQRALPMESVIQNTADPEANPSRQRETLLS